MKPSVKSNVKSNVTSNVKSFHIDHTQHKAGLYHQSFSNSVHTYDLRLVNPFGYCVHHNLPFNPIPSPILHILEHFLAHYLRQVAPTTTIYVGPMGCRTGFYLLTTSTHSEFISQLSQALSLILNNISKVPSNNIRECGNPIPQHLYSSIYQSCVTSIIKLIQSFL